MESKKSNGGLVGFLIGIVVMLLVFVGLLATNTISFSSKSNSNTNMSNGNKVEDNTVQNNNNNNRDFVIDLLKTTLSNQEWVNENLYSKENCFGNKVEKDKQELKFEVLSDNNNNPIIIVSDYSFDDFVVACYKVYVNNGKVISKSVDGLIGHPSHIGYSVDKEQGLVVSNWGHQGNYQFIAYDVKSDDIKEYDKYKCDTGNCVYEYKGDKKYNLSDISIELNSDNINKYIK